VELTTTVSEILERKGHEIHAVDPGTSVYDALAHMAEKNVGALLVLDQGHLIGIMSERDYARKIVLAGRLSHGTDVSEIMTPNPICVEADQTIGECMAIMTHRRVRHLPVLEHSELVGIVSIGDVVKAVIAEQEYVIDQLEHYITGRAPSGVARDTATDLGDFVD